LFLFRDPFDESNQIWVELISNEIFWGVCSLIVKH